MPSLRRSWDAALGAADGGTQQGQISCADCAGGEVWKFGGYSAVFSFLGRGNWGNGSEFQDFRICLGYIDAGCFNGSWPGHNSGATPAFLAEICFYMLLPSWVIPSKLNSRQTAKLARDAASKLQAAWVELHICFCNHGELSPFLAAVPTFRDLPL